MAGFMDTLFGPDGPGGQPGIVGNALSAIGNAGVDAAKTVAQLPLTLATLPTDFLKQPDLFIGSNGHADLAAILSKDYRKQKAADIQGEKDFERLRRQAAGMDWAQKMFFGNDTGRSPAGNAEAAIASGLPQDQAEMLRQRDMAQSALLGAERANTQGALGQIGVPPEIARFAGPDDVMDTYNARQRDAALAADRSQRQALAERKEKRIAMTPAEKKVEAYQRAVASGDPIAIEAAKADLLTIGKSNAQMTVVKPGGEVITGGADDVTGFESTTARDNARKQQDSAKNVLATIQEMRDVLKRQPAVAGASGAVAGGWQDLAQQGQQFLNLRAGVQTDLAGGKVEDTVVDRMAKAYDPAFPEFNALEMTLAFAVARANNPDGRISDKDLDNAIRQVRGGNATASWLSNPESVGAALDVLERSTKRIADQATDRAKPFKKPNPLRDAIEGKKPSLKDKQALKTKPPSEMTDDELSMELLRLEGK